MADASPTSQTLKSRLENGETLYGLFILSSSPTLAEIAGLSGYDFVLVDMEHAHGGITNALHCLRALAAARTPAILRVPDLDSTWTKKALDLGPQGIMFPLIDNPEMARKAVSYCKLEPDGVRGCAPRFVRATKYGLDTGYLANYLDDLLIMCQVESEEGARNIEEIAAVDGVDCVQIGPSDLCASMGYARDPQNKKVKEVLRAVETGMANREGKGGACLGGIATPYVGAQEMRKRGYRMIAAGADIGFFREACVEDVKKFKMKEIAIAQTNGVNGNGVYVMGGKI